MSNAFWRFVNYGAIAIALNTPAFADKIDTTQAGSGLSEKVVNAQTNLVYTIRFGDYIHGPISHWLQSKGFKFSQDFNRSNIINLNGSDNKLTINTRRPAFGIMLNESVNVRDFTYVEIDWGINRFPEGASYERNVRNESIMVIIFLGDERKSSGSMLIPDSPYFIALFLCHGDDRLNHPYVGTYYKKSGRYVCLDRPTEGHMVTTRFNLLEAYRQYYDDNRDDDPAVSGLGLSVDTKKASASGRSSAFIREIRFFR